MADCDAGVAGAAIVIIAVLGVGLLMGRRSLWHGHAEGCCGGNFLDACTCTIELPIAGATQNIMTLDVGYACGWAQHEDNVVIPDHNIRGA